MHLYNIKAHQLQIWYKNVCKRQHSFIFCKLPNLLDADNPMGTQENNFEMKTFTNVKWETLEPGTSSFELFAKLSTKNANLNLPCGRMSCKLGHYLKPADVVLSADSISIEDDLESLTRDFHPGTFRIESDKADVEFRCALATLRKVYFTDPKY